jgi:hypothetical protein
MRELRAEVDIDAPPDPVWEVLTDFPSYSEWNPFIIRIEGEPRARARLTVTIRPPGRRALTFHPTVLAGEPGRELRWLGHLWVPGIFDGEHIHTIQSLDGGRSRYVQRERFRGVLVPLIGSMLEATQAGFDAMCAALKARAEAG